jgi:hypothetical protein
MRTSKIMSKQYLQDRERHGANQRRRPKTFKEEFPGFVYGDAYDAHTDHILSDIFHNFRDGVLTFLQPEKIEQKVLSSFVISTVPTKDLYVVASDIECAIDVRASALRELYGNKDARATRYAISQLNELPIHDEWLKTIVFFIEEMVLPLSVTDLERIGYRLLDIASELHKSSKVGVDRVIWSALRRAATLVPADPSLFAGFLTRAGAIDARSVALTSIERLYDGSPPSQPVLVSVADRINDLCKKFLDRDVFARGENALIAQCAIGALAAIGDRRLVGRVEDVLLLNRKWMKSNIHMRLKGILERWIKNGYGESYPFKLVNDTLKKLN